VPERLRVLIVDDEPLARQRIEDLLAKKDSIDIVGTASNGSEAVEMIRRLSPNLVFLDVQMPGMSGLDVVDTIGPEQMPATIFTTAYDKFALKAFDRAAVDYLMKPFDDERFSQALRRARKTIELQEVGRMTRRLAALLEEELSVFLEDRSSSPFGKDLAKVATPGEGAKRNAAS